MKTHTLILLAAAAGGAFLVYRIAARKRATGGSTAQNLNAAGTVPQDWWAFSQQYPSGGSPVQTIAPGTMPDIWGPLQ